MAVFRSNGSLYFRYVSCLNISAGLCPLMKNIFSTSFAGFVTVTRYFLRYHEESLYILINKEK